MGYVGPDPALPVVLEGLRRLEYRGYDSSGVALLTGGLSIVKRAGKLGELEAALEAGAPPPARSASATRGGPRTARPPTATPTPTRTATAGSP